MRGCAARSKTGPSTRFRCDGNARRVGAMVARLVPKADNDDDPSALRAEIERLKSALAQAERQVADLEARADIDPLLGILNRRGFARELARSLAYVKRYSSEAALVIIDLDGFKAVNDRNGHA